jgi:hypothetical protein
MKRIVILIDGTWNKEGTTGDTNVAKLDSANRIVANAFIRNKSTDGTLQHVRYHDESGQKAISSRSFWAEPSVSGLRKLYSIAMASWLMTTIREMRFIFSVSLEEHMRRAH